MISAMDGGKMVSLHKYFVIDSFLDSSDDSGKSAYNNSIRYLFSAFLDYELDGPEHHGKPTLH